MKTLIAILAAGAVLGAAAQQARADCGWATAGKVLTGVFVGSAVARAFTPPPPAPAVVYTSPQVVYAPPAVSAPVQTVAPAPVYVQSAPAVVYSAPVVYPAPVYPAYPYYYGGPVVGFHYGWGGGHYYYHHHH
jgi:hypothetical protein